MKDAVYSFLKIKFDYLQLVYKNDAKIFLLGAHDSDT